MSFNRENIIWQSRDGKWNRGFYEVSPGYGGDDEEYDPEWDVDYNYESFEWVSTGHATQEEAWKSWDGANPGGADMRVPEGDGDDEALEQLGDMAYIHQQQEKARGKEMHSNGWGYGGFSLGGTYGRARSHEVERPASRLAKRYYDGKLEMLRHQVNGASNCFDGHAEFMGEKLRERLDGGTLSAEELEQVAQEEKRYRREARAFLDEVGEEVRNRRGRVSVYSEFYNVSADYLKRAEDELAQDDDLSKEARKQLREKRAVESEVRGRPDSRVSRSTHSSEATAPGERKPYHINPETGRANICRATKQPCKYAVDGKEPPHYGSKDEARAAYEQSRRGESIPRGVRKKRRD